MLPSVFTLDFHSYFGHKNYCNYVEQQHLCWEIQPTIHVATECSCKIWRKKCQVLMQIWFIIFSY